MLSITVLPCRESRESLATGEHGQGWVEVLGRVGCDTAVKKDFLEEVAFELNLEGHFQFFSRRTVVALRGGDQYAMFSHSVWTMLVLLGHSSDSNRRILNWIMGFICSGGLGSTEDNHLMLLSQGQQATLGQVLFLSMISAVYWKSGLYITKLL